MLGLRSKSAFASSKHALTNLIADQQPELWRIAGLTLPNSSNTRSSIPHCQLFYHECHTDRICRDGC